MMVDAISRGVPESLISYVGEHIIPRYDSFDKGHRRDHVNAVIEQALYLSQFYDVDVAAIYTAAAYHDTGLCECRETHHLVSGQIIRADRELRRWFSEEMIEVIAQAAEDHRASAGREPRTQYGKIIAEADRQIVPETVVRRTIQYGLSHYPELDREGHWQRTLDHLREKYEEGGYLKLWVPESPNAERLAELRRFAADRKALREFFDSVYEAETK